MGGIHRHWAQIMLFAAAIAVAGPFLHFGWFSGPLDHRHVAVDRSSTSVRLAVSTKSPGTGSAIDHELEQARLRVLVSD